MKATTIALVGIGGYGSIYLDHILGNGGKQCQDTEQAVQRHGRPTAGPSPQPPRNRSVSRHSRRA